jgi:hypothetical protein
MKLENVITGHLTIDGVAWPLSQLKYSQYDNSNFSITTLDGGAVASGNFATITNGDTNTLFTSIDDLRDFISQAGLVGGGSSIGSGDGDPIQIDTSLLSKETTQLAIKQALNRYKTRTDLSTVVPADGASHILAAADTNGFDLEVYNLGTPIIWVNPTSGGIAAANSPGCIPITQYGSYEITSVQSVQLLVPVGGTYTAFKK